MFSQKNGKTLAFSIQNKAKLDQNLIITFVFEKNTSFFRRQLLKTEDNFDHTSTPGVDSMNQLRPKLTDST
jgi:hypothetical protein